MKQWFEDSSKGMSDSAVLLDQFNKQIEQFYNQTKNSWEQLLKIVQSSHVDSTERTMETGGQADLVFKTILGVDGQPGRAGISRARPPFTSLSESMCLIALFEH